MKRIFTCTMLSAMMLLFLTAVSSAAPFTGGNLVVCRVGDGSAVTNAATVVFLDEYTIAGTFVQTIALPVADAGANQILTVSGTATSECLMTRSADAKYLLIAGYDATPGTATPNTMSSATIQRVVARVGNNGVVDTSTTTTAFSALNIRGAASDNGINIWMSGSGTGAVYTTFGASGAGTIVAATPTANLRTINIFGGQLYTSSASSTIRLSAIGTGLPITTGQAEVNLPGFPTSGGSPYNYFFADLTAAVAGVDTVYVSDDGTGLQKYSLVGGNWVTNGSPVLPTIRGLTGISLAGPLVNLYATTSTGANLSTYSDATGYNAIPVYTATNIATAATNTLFRSVSFVPLPTTAIYARISGRVTTSGGRPISNSTMTLSGGNLPQPLVTVTGSMGYYSFPEVEVGHNYVLTVSAKRYRFADPTRLINNLQDNINDADFVATPQDF